MRRVEDDRLLRGAGRFVDDIEWPGLLHACMVRSPVAHGRLRALDLSAARAHPGVQAVLAYADLRHLFRYDRIPQSIASGMVTGSSSSSSSAPSLADPRRSSGR